MKIEAKEFLIILLGIIGSLILTTILSNNIVGIENISLQNMFIILIIAIIFIIYVLYKRIGEIDDNIYEIKSDYNRLEERLKIHSQLTNIGARLIALEKNDKESRKPS